MLSSVDGLFKLSETVRSRLVTYAQMLARWNASINLVAARSLEDVQNRHFVDSLQLLDLAPRSVSTWADLGSGGGFPGMVIAIAAASERPLLHVTLLEADQRKAEFLRAVSRETRTDVTIIAQRIEHVAPMKADVITARALAPLSNLCEYAERHSGMTSVSLFMKGASFPKELASARKSWSFDCEVITSITDPEAAVLRIRNLVRA